MELDTDPFRTIYTCQPKRPMAQNSNLSSRSTVFMHRNNPCNYDQFLNTILINVYYPPIIIELIPIILITIFSTFPRSIRQTKCPYPISPCYFSCTKVIFPYNIFLALQSDQKLQLHRACSCFLR